MAGIFDSIGNQDDPNAIPFALRLMMMGNAMQNFGGRGGGGAGGGNASIIQGIMEQRKASAAEAKHQRFLESYVQNIDDPQIRAAILSGEVSPGDLFKNDFELKKQKAGADQALALEKWKHDNDPNTQMFEQFFGGLGGGANGGGGATPPPGVAQGPVSPTGAGPEVLTPGAGAVADPALDNIRKKFNVPDLTRQEAIALVSGAANKGLTGALEDLRKSRLEARKVDQELVDKSIAANTVKEEFSSVSEAIGKPPKAGAPAAEWEAFAQGVSDYAGFKVSPQQAKAFSVYRSLEKRDKYLEDIRPKTSLNTINVGTGIGENGLPSSWTQLDKPNADGSTTYQTGVNPDGSPILVNVNPKNSKAAIEADETSKLEERKSNLSATANLRQIGSLDELIGLAKTNPDAFGWQAQTGLANISDRNAYIKGRGLMTSVAAELSRQELQTMRDNSKTGGAVGQVTEEEWKRLASIQTALAAEGQNYDAPTFIQKAQQYRTAVYDVANGTNYSGNYPEHNANMPQKGPESGMRVGATEEGAKPPAGAPANLPAGWTVEEFNTLTEAEKKKLLGG